MNPAHPIVFPPFRLDPVNEQLWREDQLIPLPPKTFAVLRYLVEHAGRLVTKEELIRAVWAGTRVSEGVLKGYIRDLREVLGDHSEAPRFIETVPRRGHRFVAVLNAAPPVQGSRFNVQRSDPGPPTSNAGRSPAPSTQHPAPMLVGREVELRQLQGWLERALSGERQIVFVTGEPGIGKTTLMDAFLARVTADATARIGRGQCVEHYGAGEAYLPVLEALGRLGRAPEGERLLAILSRHAPTWLIQMPTLISDEELTAIQRRVQGPTRERMLRELAEALEVLTQEIPLVLALEDLHWSDYATIDLLSVLARRREPARLLIVGTYRPADVSVSDHPLKTVKRELQLHGQSIELALGFLTETAVKEYLALRFPGSALPAALTQVIHHGTDGNALFMANVVNDLVAQGTLAQVNGTWVLTTPVDRVAVNVPESLRQMIEKQIERLDPKEQQILEVASVAGAEFSAAVLTAGGMDEREGEEFCEALVRRNQFLRACGIAEWPNGTVAARYGFIHALYQNVLYERVPVGRRVRLHQHIGALQEAGYGTRAGEIAAELAMHFEQGRDYRRAVQYHDQAAQRALQRSANHEAIVHQTAALRLLQNAPETPERIQQELSLQLALGAALSVTKGYTAPEAERAYARARVLSRQVQESAQLFPALMGPWIYYMARGEHNTMSELEAQLLNLARRTQDPVLLLLAHYATGNALTFVGDFVIAHEHLEQAITLYDPQQHRALAFQYGEDPGVISLGFDAWSLWCLGYPDQARKKITESITLARDLAHQLSLGQALDLAAIIQQFCRRGRLAQEQTEEAIHICTEHGFPYWLAWGRVLRGWALVEQGQRQAGIEEIEHGLAAYRETGAELMVPHFLTLLAEAYGEDGQPGKGLVLLEGALAITEKNDERGYEAELYRIKGQLTLQQFKVQGSTFNVANPQSLPLNPQAEAEAKALLEEREGQDAGKAQTDPRPGSNRSKQKRAR